MYGFLNQGLKVNKAVLLQSGNMEEALQKYNKIRIVVGFINGVMRFHYYENMVISVHSTKEFCIHKGKSHVSKALCLIADYIFTKCNMCVG